MNAATLLLICDHRGEGLAQRLEPLSASGWRLEVSASLRRSLDLIAGSKPALIILDPLSQGPSEFEAIERVRALERPVPVLVVVGPEGDVPAVLQRAALASGPWDFVRRDAPPQEFARRLELLRTQAARAVEIDALRHSATHDDRTDLLRPRAFLEQVRAHFSAAQRHGMEIALLMIDLDRFGQVNKRHGHAVGDLLISQVGNVIRGALRTEDIAGRPGGDEFSVLLPYTRKVDAARVVQRLLEGIRALSGQIGGLREPIRVSASIGFETFNGTDLDSAESLREHADRAMTLAKRRGGDQGLYYRSLGQEELSAPLPPPDPPEAPPD